MCYSILDPHLKKETRKVLRDEGMVVHSLRTADEAEATHGNFQGQLGISIVSSRTGQDIRIHIFNTISKPKQQKSTNYKKVVQDRPSYTGCF